MGTKVTKTPRRLKGHCEVMIWNVPIDVKIAFRKRCVEKQVSMRDAIIAVMQDFAHAP